MEEYNSKLPSFLELRGERHRLLERCTAPILSLPLVSKCSCCALMEYIVADRDTVFVATHATIQGSNCSMFNNTLFEPGAPPPEAQAIMDGSGTKGNAFNTAGESQGYWDIYAHMAKLLEGPKPSPVVEVFSHFGAGTDTTGFGCAAPGSPPPPPGQVPAFNPPFQNCHC